uniref:Uncharacterized protein n=1 Tax=Romanomermis culicivorax TaxID=13658 RepID=A0A915KJR8_ROMCU
MNQKAKTREEGEDLELMCIKAKNISNVIEISERKREYHVLLQAVLICSLMLITTFSTLFIPLIFHSKWTNVVTELIWLSCGSTNHNQEKVQEFHFEIGCLNS